MAPIIGVQQRRVLLVAHATLTTTLPRSPPTLSPVLRALLDRWVQWDRLDRLVVLLVLPALPELTAPTEQQAQPEPPAPAL